MRSRIQARLREVLTALRDQGVVPAVPETLPVERPKRPEHGDFATGIALGLAKTAGKPPRQIAEAIAALLPDGRTVASAEVAGPGFINLRLSPLAFATAVLDILQGRPGALRPAPEKPQSILIEFVSANPTGPLHIGHGRGAVVGDALTAVLRAAGHSVTAEYYWNDRGNQVRLLGESVGYRYRQTLGLPAQEPSDQNWYRGEYITELARALALRDGDQHKDKPISDPVFLAFGEERIKAWIRDDLEALGVRFDVFTSERALVETGRVDRVLGELERRQKLAPEDGAQVLLTQQYGDEKNRVIRKSSGDLTYFGTDIAYHVDKFERGFARLIDVWGGDHHGHVRRMKIALEALDRDPNAFEVILAQMVSVTRGGQPVLQSKRAGNFIILREVVDEIGRDAVRFFFLMRRHDSQLELDIDLAKKQSMDNPVYYIQYAHARLCSIVRRATELGFSVPCADDPRAPALIERLGAEERDIIGVLAGYPGIIADAARAREPHRVVFFLQELAQAFASYFTRLQKVHHDTILPQRSQRVGDWQARWDRDLTLARLLWVSAIRKVFADALALAGVSAPERMGRLAEDDSDSEEETPRA